MPCSDLPGPARFDHRRRRRFDHHRRPFETSARRQATPKVDRRAVERSTDIELRDLDGFAGGVRRCREAGFLDPLRRTDQFHAHGLHDQRLVRVDEPETLTVGAFECKPHAALGLAVPVDRQGGVGPLVADRQLPPGDPAVRRNTLSIEFPRGLLLELERRGREPGRQRCIERRDDRTGPQQPMVGQSHAVSGQYAGERMQENGANPK